MASKYPNVGAGVSVTFGTSGFGDNVLSLNPYSIARASVETTHLGTTVAKTFMPSDLYDGGELSGTWQFNPDTDPPKSADAENITITFPDGGLTDATAAFSGFLTAYNPSVGGAEEIMTVEVTVKITGEITITPAS